MKTAFLLFICLAIFAIGYAISFYLFEMYLKKKYKKDVNRKIKEIMFQELGFTYRETASGKKYVIFDDYKSNKAIQV